MACCSSCLSNCKFAIGDYREKEVPGLAGTSSQEQSEVLKQVSKEMAGDTKVKENAEDTSDSEKTEDSEETVDAQDTEDSEDRRVVEIRVSLALLAEINENYLRLKRVLNDWEQSDMMCDMEIGRVPEIKGENLVRLVITIGEYLGVRILEHHVEFAVRMGIRWYGEAQEPNRNRRIVVRLASSLLRDILLRAAYRQRIITTTDLGLPGAPQRIYFCERLTHMNRRLFRMVRNECRTQEWRYLWIKHGRIYIRKDRSSNIYAIRNEDNMYRAFQVE